MNFGPPSLLVSYFCRVANRRSLQCKEIPLRFLSSQALNRNLIFKLKFEFSAYFFESTHLKRVHFLHAGRPVCEREREMLARHFRRRRRRLRSVEHGHRVKKLSLTRKIKRNIFFCFKIWQNAQYGEENVCVEERVI